MPPQPIRIGARACAAWWPATARRVHARHRRARENALTRIFHRAVDEL